MKPKRKNSEQAKNWGAPIAMGVAMGVAFGVSMGIATGIALGIGMTFAFYPVFNQTQIDKQINTEQNGD